MTVDYNLAISFYTVLYSNEGNHFQMERANYNLDSYIQCARQGEVAGGRLVSHLLTNPAEDGGQWDMLVNVIEKHGVIPKSCFTESQSAESTRRMCFIINNKVTHNGGKMFTIFSF